MWRLAMDLGTNSIGWAAYELETRNDKTIPYSLIDSGVRIFSDGREPAADGRVGDPKAVSRRLARGMRRNRDRRQGRIRDTAAALIKAGLLPEDRKGRDCLMKSCPFIARDAAARKPVSPHVLGRALFHLGKRRGFKSNRITDGEEETGGKLAEAQNALKSQLGDLTLGQWQCALRRSATSEHATPRVRFREGSDFYPTRSMYEAEFDKIREIQEPHQSLNAEQWLDIRNIIFHQRSLCPVERGRCRFFPDDRRLFRAMPSAQRFRIAQDVAHLEWIDSNRVAHRLTQVQRDVILKLLNHQKTVAFSRIRKTKENGKYLFPEAVSFNREDLKTKNLAGNATACEMRDPALFGDKWDALSIQEQDEAVELLFESQDDAPIRTLAVRHGLTEAQSEMLTRKKFARTTASVGITLARAAAPLMEQGIVYSAAIAEIDGPNGQKLHHSLEEAPGTLDFLPYYGVVLSGSTMGGDPTRPQSDVEAHWGRIANPTVHVAMNQVTKLVNRLIERFGKPDQVVIEVGRQLKNSSAERARIMKMQAQFESENNNLRKEAQSLGIAIPSRADLSKIRMWHELGGEALDRACLYCGKPISGADIANGRAEVEHILPFSRTLDDTRANKTLAHVACNREKRDRTPFEAWGNTPQWATIATLVERLPQSRQWRFQPDAMERFNLKGDFLARQSNDNAYIARLARRYLRAVCTDVWTTTGQLTAWLRNSLRLNSPELGLGDPPHPWKKNRHDHRHHAVDAMTIGLVDRSLLQSVNTARSADGRLRIRFGAAHDARTWLIPQAKVALARMIVSIKPDHGLEGPFFQERAYGAIQPERRDPDLPNHTLISKVPFASLKEAEIDRIRDKSLRSDVQNWLAQAADSNETLDVRLAAFAKNWEKRYGKPLHAIRVLYTDRSSRAIESEPYKRYAAADYAYVDIWRVQAGKPGNWKPGEYKFEGRFVSYLDAANSSFDSKLALKPHPSSKYMMRLFKGDIVTVVEKSLIRLMRIAGFSTTNNKLDLQPLNAANPSGQNYVSINVLMKDRAMRRLLVRPDGTVRNPEALRAPVNTAAVPFS